MSDSLKCPACGGENPSGSPSCEHCAKSAWAAAQPAKKPNLAVSIGVGLLVYLAGCNVGLFLRQMQAPSTPPPAVVQPAE